MVLDFAFERFHDRLDPGFPEKSKNLPDPRKWRESG
jgi:hypothetical protein